MDVRELREELTAHRLLIQSSNKAVADKLDAISQKLDAIERRPGWRIYGVALILSLIGWILPW